MHWLPSENGMVLYIPTAFDRSQGEEGLVGVWQAAAGSESSFIFASNGHFLEDGVFTGTYLIDEERNQITLQYGGLFQDTAIYYSFAGDQLIVWYPWTMVKQS